MPTMKPATPAAQPATERSTMQPAVRPVGHVQSVDSLADSDGVATAVTGAESTAPTRTFSANYPWDYGTQAGSYQPSYFVNYSHYLAGYGGLVGYGGFSPYRVGSLGFAGGYLGGFPYLAAYQPYGYYGNWYGGYRPWGWGGLPLYTASVYGIANYGINGFSVPAPGYPGPFGYPAVGNFAGCCYW
jgi:hypothetical protein